MHNVASPRAANAQNAMLDMASPQDATCNRTRQSLASLTNEYPRPLSDKPPRVVRALLTGTTVVPARIQGAREGRICAQRRRVRDNRARPASGGSVEVIDGALFCHWRSCRQEPVHAWSGRRRGRRQLASVLPLSAAVKSPGASVRRDYPHVAAARATRGRLR